MLTDRSGRKVCASTSTETTSQGVTAFQRIQRLPEKAGALRDLLSRRILVLDCALGTMPQQRHLTAADFGGAALKGCNQNLVRSRPDVALDIHRGYLDAGSDIIETNWFGGALLAQLLLLPGDPHGLLLRWPGLSLF